MTRFIRTVQLAMKSLLLHKLRSGLTMLGIVFGVFSVIAMLAIGEGASSQAQQQVLALGATNIIVVSKKPPDDAAGSATGGRTDVLRYGLTKDDHRILSRTLPSVTGEVAIRETTLDIRHLERNMTGRVVGCTPGYMEMNHLTIARGRFLTDEDVSRLANVAVIASGVAKTLFPVDDPIGKPLQISARAYVVVGVMQERTASAAVGGSLSGQNYNEDVYIPLDTFQSRINTGGVIMRRTSGSFSAESVIYNQITFQVEKPEDVIPTADVVRETLERTHGTKQDYSVVVPLELLKQADQLRNIFNIVLGSIAGISLLVGGIGIMNIMLATVTERTREIGIRRALGARRNDIIQQFISETVVLSGTGGLIGMALGLSTPIVFRVVKYVVENYVLESKAGMSDVGRMFLEMTPRSPSGACRWPSDSQCSRASFSESIQPRRPPNSIRSKPCGIPEPVLPRSRSHSPGG